MTCRPIDERRVVPAFRACHADEAAQIVTGGYALELIEYSDMFRCAAPERTKDDSILRGGNIGGAYLGDQEAPIIEPRPPQRLRPRAPFRHLPHRHIRAIREIAEDRHGLFKFHDHSIDRKAVAWRGIDFGDYRVALGLQDVFHLHGFNDA